MIASTTFELAAAGRRLRCTVAGRSRMAEGMREEPFGRATR
jgi:hypothetical protein